MAEILRDVVIQPPTIEGKKMIINGVKGGELRFSPAKRVAVKSMHQRNDRQPLLVNCYRTDDLIVDVSNYHGNKGELIKIKKNSGKNDFMKKNIMLYLIAFSNKLIEYGELKRIKRLLTSEILFEYKAKETHQFKEVKLICSENLCQRFSAIGSLL